jgi:hypothetical protein
LKRDWRCDGLERETDEIDLLDVPVPWFDVTVRSREG